MRRSTAAVSIALCSALFAALAAAQDWPVSRHDFQRTGLQPLGSDIQVPAIRASISLGGGLTPTQWRIGDANLDGHDEVIAILGGAAVARRFDGTLVWASDLLSLNQVLALADLDRNERPEVWVSGRDAGIFALDGDTGEVLWHPAVAAGQRLGSVFTLDVEGDGALELYVADSGCAMGGAGTGRVYRFDDGFPDGAIALDVSQHGYWCGSEQAAGDLDGDGQLEIVALSNDRVVAYDAATGAPLWATESLGAFPFGRGTTHIADVDADGRAEIVVLSNEPGTVVTAKRLMLVELTEDVLSRRFALDFDAAAGAHQAVNPPVAELAPEPGLEIATSWYDPADTSWRTVVYAGTAETGEPPLLVLLGEALLAIADLDGDDVAELITIEADSLPAPRFGRVIAHRLVAGGEYEPLWTFERAALGLELGDWNRHRAPVRIAGEPIAVLTDEDQDGRAETLWALEPDGTSGEPRVLDGAVGAAVRTIPGGIALSRSDGFVEHLDAELLLINDLRPFDGDADLRVGAYLASGLVARGGPDALLATVDAVGSALVYHVADPPAELWRSAEQLVPSSTGLTAPLQWLGPDTIAYRTRELDGSLSLRLVDEETGDLVEEIGIDSDGQIGLVNDVVPLRTGDGIAGLVQGLGDARTSEIWFESTDAESGSVLDLELDRVFAGDCWERPGTAWDLTADGTEDFLTSQGVLLRAADGASGERIVDLTGSGCNLMTVADLDGQPGAELLLHGALGAARRTLDMSVVWSQDAGLVHFAGAIAPRAEGWMSLLMVRQGAPHVLVRDTDMGALLGEAILAGGQAYPDLDAAAAAGAKLGTLSPGIAVDDLTGEGHASFVVSSTDGWLYALSAQDASLDWSINLRSAAGEPIAADFDGDGASELAVATSDGHVHVVDRASIAAPAFVYDTDGTFVALADDEDVDVLFSAIQVGANWGAVADAEGYEVQLIRDDNVVVAPWTDLGDERRIVLDGLSLVPGQRYVALVRAYNRSDGRVSVEVESDGFTIEDGEPPSVALGAEPDTVFLDPRRGQSWTEVLAFMRDDVALARYRIWVEDLAGNEVRELERAEIGGTERISTSVWYGNDAGDAPVAGATYRIVARSEDGVGREGTGAVEVLVCGPENADSEKCAGPPEAEADTDASADPEPQPEPVPDAGEPEADIPMELEEEDFVAGDDASEEGPVDLASAEPEGCGCTSSGAPSSWLGPLLMVWVVRRRARPAKVSGTDPSRPAACHTEANSGR